MKTHLWSYSVAVAALSVATGAFADVSLNAVGGDGKIVLSWSTTDKLRNVQVYRDTDADPQGRQRVAVLSAGTQSYTDTRVVKGTQYWYWIKYTDADGVVGNSNAGSATAGDDEDRPIAVRHVTVTPTRVTVKAGASSSLSAAVIPANATNKAVTWRSSNTRVATVSSTGVVTGVARGHAVIIAAAAGGHRTATSYVTVTAEAQSIPVSGVTVTPTSVTVKAGASSTLSAAVAPANATNKAITWSSSSTGVATVSATGVVTGVAAGNAVITAATADGNRTASSAVTVTSEPQTIPVTGVTVMPTSVTVKAGASSNLSAAVAPANATNKAITWSSSNTGVATVSATGVVTGVAAGNAVITATSADGGRSASSNVAVTAADSGNPGTCSNATPATLPMTFDGAGEFCRVTSGTISEFNSWNVERVDINGVVYTNAYWNVWSANKLPAKINGNYTIHYVAKYPWSHLEVNGSGGSQSNTVAVTGVTVTPASVTVKAGASTSLSAAVAPANASNTGVNWSSSNSGVATVSGNGVVTGVAGGTAVITATTADGGRTATSTVTVSAQANSAISAAITSFDKNAAKQADLAVVVTLNGNTLNAIRNGSAALASGSDYTVSGNTVTLLKGYLARQAVGALSLTFDFSAGTDPVLSLTIADSSSGVTAPAAPSGLSATVIDNGTVDLTWIDQSNNEQGFRIERQRIGDSTWTTVETAANVHSYHDATVAMGNSYQYRVYAFNAGSVSSAATATAALLTLHAYGEAQYTARACNVCHGADGKGGTSPLPNYNEAQLAALIDKIASTMPTTDPKCVGNCAQGTARYLIDIMAGGSGPAPDACVGTPPPSPRSLRLLTRQEYQNTVNDLLGLTVNLVNTMPAENRVDGFDDYVADNVVTGLRIEAFHAQALSLATQAVAQSWNKIVPCGSQDTACAKQFIQSFGKKAYRRPLTADEQADYLALFNGNTFNAAVEIAVGRMLASPNFLYRSELGVQQADGSYRLTPYETASALSYLFLGSLPDDTLFSAADQKQLDSSQQLETQATRLLGLTRARDQVGNFVGQWLLSASPYALPDKDKVVYPRFTADVKLSMSNELINFFNHVALDSTQKFSELFSANYIVANKTLADFYGVGGTAGSNFSTVPVQDGTRNGIMTLGAVLSRYANSNESHPFKRGGFVYKRLLCDDLPPPANVGIVKAPKQDPNATTRQRFDFHSKSDASCWSCHQYLDAAGFTFEHYDGAGQYRATENGRPIDASGNVLGIETYTPSEQTMVSDLNGLSQVVANSPNAAQCVARQYYRYTTGKRETDADNCALSAYLERYKASGHNLKDMLTSIVSSPGFTLRRAK
jgi:uncharacterized protein YjdB/cytochrome c553